MFQEFLTRKEDYLRALRGFLREVVRVIRNEFNFTSFVRSLMQERSEMEFGQLEPTHRVCTYYITCKGDRVSCIGKPWYRN